MIAAIVLLLLLTALFLFLMIWREHGKEAQKLKDLETELRKHLTQKSTPKSKKG